jgi:hypothetical protein
VNTPEFDALVEAAIRGRGLFYPTW